MTFLAISNPVTSGIAKLFHPLVYAVAWTLAFIYGIIPNYAVAIAILTVLIMACLTPLTVKSTRSMISMQRLQPELKRLQQKYKGPENRTELNEEMMKLYKEHGVNPASGCIAGFLSMPFLFILYSVIRGLSNTVKVHGVLTSMPKDIPHGTRMYRDLINAHPAGAMLAFHVNLALKPLSPHGSWVDALPFYGIIVVAVGLQYFQMSQLNRRNPNSSQLSSQMAMFQKVTPLLFAYIYFVVPAAAAVYMIFSSIIRIVTQDLVFRFDRPAGTAPREKTLPAAKDGDAKGGGTATPPSTSTNGAAPSPTTQKAPTAAAAAKTLPPAHPRSKAKKKRKAR
jgi:YidC/Oxa1 family membrane protein insertase